MNEEKQENISREEFKDLVKELPCLCCIIRPTCFHPNESLIGGFIKEYCNEAYEWMEKEKYFYGIPVKIRIEILRQISNEFK